MLEMSAEYEHPTKEGLLLHIPAAIPETATLLLLLLGLAAATSRSQTAAQLLLP
jgi:hypothetical protein